MKIVIFSALSLSVLIITSTSLCAQQIIGFWEIKEVKVGDEIMTPVAKWTKINADHTYQSGNGWLQNAVGTWTYDMQNKTFFPKETNGIKDEFGAFNVSFDHNNMIWERTEEGMSVTVTLAPITEMPMSTADQLVGLWDLTKVIKNEQNITSDYDPNDKHYIFIRWDRIFVARTPEGTRATGYWHIHGHRPELTLMSHNPDKGIESWRVSVNNSDLNMIGISDSNKNLELIFSRLNAFPE